MNQILAVEKKKNKKERNSGPIEIRKIAKIFCVFILLFGIALVGKGSYAIIQGMDTSVATKDKLPVIDIAKEGSDIIVLASHDKEITKLTYHWNNEAEITVNGKGTNLLETTIPLPVGNNTFYITVHDIQGKQSSYEREYVIDADKPQIAFEVNGNKLKIKAKDTIALSYVTYRWDDNEETRQEPDPNSIAQLETEINIPKGEHTITVIAVNSNNVTETKTQQVKGVTKPKISIEQDQNDMKYLIITLTDDEAVKGATYTLNGQEYIIDYSTVRQPVIEYRQVMTPGENRIKLKVYNFDGVEEYYDGICVYNP